MNYLARHADAQLRGALSAFGGVLVEGPRGCGKTETARKQSARLVFLDTDSHARNALDIDAEPVLSGPFPTLLDEWQVVPSVWNQVRREIDVRASKGLYVLTGSVTPVADAARHSGATRIQRIKMRPMTLQENGVSSGTFSVSKALIGELETVNEKVGHFAFDDLLLELCRGGWPAFRGLSEADSLGANRAYLRDLYEQDFGKYFGSFNSQTAETVAREVSRTVGANMSVEKMSREISSKRGSTKAETVQTYLDHLSRLHVLEEVPGWGPNLRSKYSVYKSPKRYLVDPSLAVASLKGNIGKLKQDLKTTGFLFENLIARDLLAFAEAVGGQVFHFRDESQLEVDFIFEDSMGNWAAIEVKLGHSAVEAACVTLKKFSERVDKEAMGDPAFMAVITNADFSYIRPDGIRVIAINQLGI